MKRYVLGIGTAAAVATPVVASVSCSWINDKSVNHYKLMPTYTGEADQLLALGIKPDYYPLQLDSTKPYEYLTNPAKFLNIQDNQFREAFSNKIKSLMSGVTLGTSWWNQQALDAGEKGSDPSYWQRQSADVLLYEHYLLDDDSKVIDSAIAPKHDEAMTIQTNFRWSRDPYTRLSKGVIFGLEYVDMEYVNGKLIWSWKKDASGKDIIPAAKTPIASKDGSDSVVLEQSDIDIIQAFINDNVDSEGKGSWIYNSKFFSWIFHTMYLDNDDFSKSAFKAWIVDTSTSYAFDLDKNIDAKLEKLFAASTYTQEEVDAGITLPNYSLNGRAHHPIYEQQEGDVGAAPMFEGSMRDNMLYLFNVSYQVQNLTRWGNVYGEAAYNAATPEVKVKYDEVRNKIAKLPQHDQMRDAFANADKITAELKTRMSKMKDYFAFLGANDKTFGIVTIAPGAGQSTIQSMSKYSFLYRELGFKQPIPNNLDEIASQATEHAKQDGALFNMDDNGWWWNLGNSTESITRNLQQFTNANKGNMDIAVITARDSDFNDIVANQQPVRVALAKAIGTNTPSSQLSSMKTNYDLWNEGIKTPFVFHMVLDEILDRTEQWAKANGKSIDVNDQRRKDALSWGNYFTNTFTHIK